MNSSESLANILQNKELVEELIDSDYFDKSERLKKTGIRAETVRNYLRSLIENNVSQTEVENLEPTGQKVTEAIIKLANRPALKIIENDFTAPRTNFWSSRLEPHRDTIKKAITSVGRIEFRNHPNLIYAGTGWLVTDNIIVTNRHVAETFAFQESGKFVFDQNHAEGVKIRVDIDFREEFRVDETEEFKITDVLYIEPRSGSDIAFLKVERSSDVRLRSVMPLATHISPTDGEIVVIGYPAKDSQRNPVEPAIMFEIFEDIYDKKRLQPGFITSVSGLENQVPIFTHDCSTLGGNSGSIVLDFKKGEAVGLHFAGIFKKENQAVPATIIVQRLQDLLSGKLKIT